MKKYIVMLNLVFLFLLQSYTLFSNEVAVNYIGKYKNIAIQEMQRTGIPASIKMGQAILESNMGRSELAKKAKNHFGIKCGGKWNGDTFYLKDDDRDRKGRLVKSCFRTFESAMESFIAHSEFLKGSKSGRYNFLFKYDVSDYKAWAYGLRKAGYATDKRYPQKLINVIEKYELYHLDQNYISTDEPLFVDIDSKSSKMDRLKERENIPIDNTFTIKNYQLQSVNRVSYVQAHGGESLKDLALVVGLSVDELLEYNENHGYAAVVLVEGEPIYLNRKKRSYKGKEEIHIVQEGETMYSISQKYGIKLQNLYAKNKMPKESQPLPGERLYLQRTVPRGERPEYLKKHAIEEEETELLFATPNYE